MELYVIVPLLSLVGGGAGSFLGSYLKKKGENLATHEDINKLVAQVSAVTEATKQIEAKISDEVWGRQRVWEMKRDAIFAVVKADSASKDALINLSSAYQTAKGYPPDTAILLKQKATESWMKAAGDFDSAAAQVSLVCGQDVSNRLDSLNLFMKTAARDMSRGKPEFSLEKLSEERVAMHDAIRRELSAGHLSKPPARPPLPQG